MDTEENDITYRWEQWRRANRDFPRVREAELGALFTLLNPKPGEYIWESGTGNGNLTMPLAQAVVPGGKVVTTDVQLQNTAEVAKLAAERSLPVEALCLPLEAPLLVASQYVGVFDAVASIATLHHFDNRLEGTGEKGRIEALKVFFRALKPGGRLALADVLQDSLAQRYFDVIDNPEHAAPRGHPHDFFTKERLVEVVQQAGFTEVQVELQEVPWHFTSQAEAQIFVHTLHNAKVSPEESFEIAERMLGWNKKPEHYELGWDLFFLTARKPE